MRVQRQKILIACIFFWSAFSAVAQATALGFEREDIPLKECVARYNDVGREQPNMRSGIMRFEKDYYRTIETGGTYYFRDDSESDVDWVEVYGAENGHGSSLIGYLRRGNFECRS